jgi:DNA polymerase alpha subunit B
MVGRICCDSEGRLNERSVLLEGSIELSNGMRTKLDLSKLESFKLFPGQVCTPC